MNKLWCTKEIYDIIVGAVRQRQQLLTKIGEGEKPQDTMQLLLDAGDDTMDVVGVSNTVRLSSVLVVLAHNLTPPASLRWKVANKHFVLTVYYGLVDRWSAGDWYIR